MKYLSYKDTFNSMNSLLMRIYDIFSFLLFSSFYIFYLYARYVKLTKLTLALGHRVICINIFIDFSLIIRYVPIFLSIFREFSRLKFLSKYTSCVINMTSSILLNYISRKWVSLRNFEQNYNLVFAAKPKSMLRGHMPHS